MSFYNMLFGRNPNSEILLAILGLKESDVERFRDCGFSGDGIFIYTRTGGGNREDYPNKKLISNPYYLSDEDDGYDCTYATYNFKFPDEIKQDCIQFKNIRENGVSGKFIQWIIKTLEREESENDKYHRLWNAQNKLVQQSKQTFICETNGHTIVPFDDISLEKYLKLMEEAGRQLSYSVVPYKLEIKQEVPIYEGLYKGKNSLECDWADIKVCFPRNWEIDQIKWNRWKSKFSEKYPKAIAAIEESIK